MLKESRILFVLIILAGGCAAATSGLLVESGSMFPERSCDRDVHSRWWANGARLLMEQIERLQALQEKGIMCDESEWINPETFEAATKLYTVDVSDASCGIRDGLKAVLAATIDNNIAQTLLYQFCQDNYHISFDSQIHSLWEAFQPALKSEDAFSRAIGAAASIFSQPPASEYNCCFDTCHLGQPLASGLYMLHLASSESDNFSPDMLFGEYSGRHRSIAITTCFLMDFLTCRTDSERESVRDKFHLKDVGRPAFAAYPTPCLRDALCGASGFCKSFQLLFPSGDHERLLANTPTFGCQPCGLGYWSYPRFGAFDQNAILSMAIDHSEYLTCESFMRQPPMDFKHITHRCPQRDDVLLFNYCGNVYGGVVLDYYPDTQEVDICTSVAQDEGDIFVNGGVGVGVYRPGITFHLDALGRLVAQGSGISRVYVMSDEPAVKSK